MNFIRRVNVRAEDEHGTKGRMDLIGTDEVEEKSTIKVKRRGRREEIGGKWAPPPQTIQVIEE
jgi:hypothetical protein